MIKACIRLIKNTHAGAQTQRKILNILAIDVHLSMFIYHPRANKNQDEQESLSTLILIMPSSKS